jgi:hypothetical protein
MAEIKSTLDLIMEKTKHLTLSEKEKRELEREEQTRKVPGYVHKVLDGLLSPHGLLQELDLVPASLRDDIRRELTERFLEEFDLADKGQKSLQALQELSGSPHPAWLDRLRNLLMEFAASRKQLVTAEAERMRSELAAMGIAGSAVVVRGDTGAQWRAKEQEYARQLNEIRTAWRTTLVMPDQPKHG